MAVTGEQAVALGTGQTVTPEGVLDLGDLTSSPTYSGGGSSSGGNTTADYMREYQGVLVSLYGSAQPTAAQTKIMQLCASKKWPSSVFLALLRARDPGYVKSDDYTNRVREAGELWRQYFPGRQMPHSLVVKYARSAKNLQWFDFRIRQTKAFKAAYPYLRLAENIGSGAAAPETYRNWRALTNQAYRMWLGRDASPLEHRMLFASGLSGQEFAQRLPDILGGREAFRWAAGLLPKQRDLNAALFNRPGGGMVLQRMAKAAAVKSSYLGSENTPFGLDLNEAGAIVMPRI